MESETDQIIAFIQQRAERHAAEGKHGTNAVEHRIAAADLFALAGDIKAGLHR